MTTAEEIRLRMDAVHILAAIKNIEYRITLEPAKTDRLTKEIIELRLQIERIDKDLR